MIVKYRINEIRYGGEKFIEITYNGTTITYTSDGYLFAEKICKDAKKNFLDWFNSDEIDDLLDVWKLNEIHIDKRGKKYYNY